MFGKNIDYEDHFDSYWYLKNLANDENAAVRGAAYHALGEISHTDAAKTLFGAMLSEKDEKAKFYAIIAWAKAEKNFAADKEKIQGGAYFDPMEYIKTRYNGENLRDTEKLACACALVRLGEEEYRAKANELIGKITDEEIKEAARRDLEK